ncbi:MAG: glycosyl transferase group 1 [Mycobacterium sp.]|nr:glycosyl transferase group 1 [Mycobacterium sp.]
MSDHAPEVMLLLEQCLAPVPGGTGRYSREVAAALAAGAPAGGRVAGWVARHRDVSAARVPGVAGPSRLPLPRRALVAAWERGRGPAPRPGDGGGGAVVHAPTLLVPPPRPGVGLVVTVHDAVPWTHPETLTPRGVAFHRRMAQRALRDADALVVPTAAVAHALGGALGVDTGRFVVVGEGVAPAVGMQPPDAAARARRLDLPDGYLLSLSTLEPRKGLDVLLAALATPGAPQLPLLVVGQPGWGGVDAAEQARALGLAPGRVRVLGRLPDPDLAVVLARATALVMPSRAEGFGLPVLEAMAHGTPVVTSDVPALREVAGDAALAVPAGDAAALAVALARLAGDAGLRQRLGAAGRRRASAQTWDAAARQLWQLYAAVAGRSAAAA